MNQAGMRMGWMGIWMLVASASARTWELPVMATWTEDPRTTVTLAWERHEAGTAQVEVAERGGGPARVLEGVGNVRAPGRHVVTVRDLTPGTWYDYRVASTDGYEAEGCFWTAPANPAQPFTFVLHNDLQGGLDPAAAAVVAEAVAQAAPHFVLSTGDLGESRYARDYLDILRSWNEFFSISAGWLANSVFQPVTGNHDEPENPDSFWYRLFELPADRRDYVFDVGPIRFVMLDSTEHEPASRAAWLARELQQAAFDPGIGWVIPAFHRAPFSEGERGGDGGIQRWWVPLFTRYEADLVVSGHAHTYQRTKPIDGVTYLVSGGGGGRLYGVDPHHPVVAFATSAYHFVSFHVDGRAIRLEALLPDGTVFDRADLTVRRHVRVEPVFPARGGECTIWYDAGGGPLEGADEVWLHLGRDDFDQVLAEQPMRRDEGTGRWSANFTVPETPKWHLAFCFRNADRTVWHNNHRQNWQALVAREW
jgi:acid phosphatase type 7